MKSLYLFLITFLLLCNYLFAQSQFGKALSLLGSGDYVEVLDNNSFTANNITIEALIKTYDKTDFKKIIANYNTGSDAQWYHLFIDTSGVATIQVDDGVFAPPYPPKVCGTTNISDGEWHHIAGVRNANDKTLSIYVDGIMENMSEDTTSGFLNPSGNLWIGGQYNWPTRNWNGLIDEVRIWNVARTQHQIQKTVNAVLGPEYYSSIDSGLIAYFKFDELVNLGINGDGVDDIKDFSIYSNHGDLVGEATLVASDITVKVNNNINTKSQEFILNQNYPNPFNPSTTIYYSIPKDDYVSLKIYDILGNEIDVLINEKQLAGVYSINWYPKKLSCGVYFYRLQTRSFFATKKLIFLK